VKRGSLVSVAKAAESAATAARVRDEKIRTAHESGKTIRAIAHAAGISPSRVHQIIHGR
jgi:hypothetical protein